VFAYLRLQVPGDQLFYIRLEQVFGFICIGYWYLALAISPIGYVIGKHRTKKLEFARRAIGVSAFYFALLHAGVALWGQLGGFGELHYLPVLFKWSLLGGVLALFVLFLMAITSFDAVVRFMTCRKWKWLHRFVYAAGIAAVLHVWTIGTHLAYGGVQTAAYVALVVIAGLELFRLLKLLGRKSRLLGRSESVTLFVAAWAIVAVVILAIPTFIQNYHSRHTGHSETAHGQHGSHEVQR